MFPLSVFFHFMQEVRLTLETHCNACKPMQSHNFVSKQLRKWVHVFQLMKLYFTMIEFTSAFLLTVSIKFIFLLSKQQTFFAAKQHPLLSSPQLHLASLLLLPPDHDVFFSDGNTCLPLKLFLQCLEVISYK